MKILVIICSHEMNIINRSNIKILNDFFNKNINMSVDYCGISNYSDFDAFEDIISFKYKVINTKNQISKICDFVTSITSHLSYSESLDDVESQTELRRETLESKTEEFDWYIKIRPEIKLLEPINFEVLSKNAINARAREYIGPKRIKYGMSVNGEGIWKNIPNSQSYNLVEKQILLDDQIFIFHNNVVKKGAFNPIDSLILDSKWHGNKADESSQTNIWIKRNIDLNVIGINLEFTKVNCFSGDLNPFVCDSKKSVTE